MSSSPSRPCVYMCVFMSLQHAHQHRNVSKSILRPLPPGGGIMTWWPASRDVMTQQLWESRELKSSKRNTSVMYSPRHAMPVMSWLHKKLLVGNTFFFLNRNARPKAHSTDEEQNQKNSDSLKNKEQWPHERTTSNLNLWSYSYTALVGCFIPRLVHLCRACSVRSWPCIRALASKRHIHTPAYAVAACRWLSSQKSSSVFLKGGSAVDSLQEACAHAHTYLSVSLDATLRRRAGC